ncbi:MAG: PAS domain-containing protein, partial [Casimicrobiaceae bacterium]
MALIRSLPRLDLSTVNQTLVDAGLGPLSSLSQRKLNALGLPLAYVDRQQRYRFVNTAFLDWLGKREDEVIGREISEVLGAEIYQLYQAYVDAALAGERTGFVRQLTAPGQPAIWIRVDYYPDRGPNNTIRGFLLTYSDVDHLKRLELEAGQREHRLRLVTDSVGLPILYFDREFRLRFANRPFADWIGIPADDLIGHGLKDFLPSDAYGEMIAHVDGVFGGGTMSFERRERKQNGELRWVRVTLFPDREVNGRVGGAFAVWNDIEDDVRVRDALKAQQAQLRLFADNIPGPIAYLDKSLHYTFVNQAFANLVCKPRDEIYGRTPFEVLSAEVASYLRPVIKRAQGGEHVEYERVGTSTAGELRWVHGRVAPDLDPIGNVRGLYCTEYDIHDLKQTEQALAAREEQLRLFTDNIPEPVVYLDSERHYVFVNESFLVLTGYAREQVIGQSIDDVGTAEASLAPPEFVARALAGEAVTYERAAIDADNRPRWLRGRIVPDRRFDGTIKGVYVIAHDISDLKQVQNALAAREGQLRAIMDGVPAPVAYIDREERCHYVNRTFLQYFGLTSEQVSRMR